jgi:hypothetical protein
MEKLEEGGAQATFRDRWRSVIPVGFGLGFAPALATRTYGQFGNESGCFGFEPFIFSGRHT